MADFGTYSAYQDPARNDTVNVGLTNVIVSNARQAGLKRKVLMIRNNSTAAADIITISFGNTSTAGSGIVLKQYESVTDSNDGGYECWQGTVTAVCATANGVLNIMER
jgi:hypothetical protein